MLLVVKGYHQLCLLLEDWLSQLITSVGCQQTCQLNDDQNVSNLHLYRLGYVQEALRRYCDTGKSWSLRLGVSPEGYIFRI